MSITFFFCGIACVTFALAALLFLKFKKASGDRLFGFLSIACTLLALERVVGLMTYVLDPSDAGRMHTRSWLYLFRLVSFSIILISVIDKNRSKTKV
jgi:hypothetical protein